MAARGFALISLIFLFGLSGVDAARADVPRVVASIKPVHSLVANVMAGIGVPHLLVRGAGSPHSYILRPSEARALSQADIVFWIGPDFETFLRRPMRTLAPNAFSVALMNQSPVKVLSGRGRAAFSIHEGSQENKSVHSHSRDGHIWLDPMNAIAMVEVISENLQQVDRENAEFYAANARETISRLRQLDQELIHELESVRSAPFIIFHDVLQYLEARYDLNGAGFIVETPEHIPSAKQIAATIAQIDQKRPKCIFAEISSDPNLTNMLRQETSLNSGVLDPEGVAQVAGPEFYFLMMRKLVYDFVVCMREPALNVR